MPVRLRRCPCRVAQLNSSMSKIILEPLTEAFVGVDYINWLSDPEVTYFLEVGSRVYTELDLKNYIVESKEIGRQNYALIVANSGLHIGNGSIYGKTIAGNNFKIGWFIGNKHYWGGKYASSAVYELLKIGFDDIKMDFCPGFVHQDNLKARLLNKYLGFQELGKNKVCSIKRARNEVLVEIKITRQGWEKRARELAKLFPEVFTM